MLLIHVSGTVPVTEKPLNDLVTSFEAVNINPKDVLAQPDFSPRQPHRRPFKMNVKSDNRYTQPSILTRTEFYFLIQLHAANSSST